MNFVLVLEESFDDGCGDTFTAEQLIFIESNSFDEVNKYIKKTVLEAHEKNRNSFFLPFNDQSVEVEMFNFMQMKNNKKEFQNKLITLDDFIMQRSLKLKA